VSERRLREKSVRRLASDKLESKKIARQRIQEFESRQFEGSRVDGSKVREFELDSGVIPTVKSEINKERENRVVESVIPNKYRHRRTISPLRVHFMRF
jgi:hypothetical protein